MTGPYDERSHVADFIRFVAGIVRRSPAPIVRYARRLADDLEEVAKSHDRYGKRFRYDPMDAQ